MRLTLGGSPAYTCSSPERRAFFDGPSGVQRLRPLAQRLHVDFTADPRFDNPRAVQLRLANFDIARMEEVGRRERDIFDSGVADPARMSKIVDDEYVATLAHAVTGGFRGKVGVAPRIFLKGSSPMCTIPSTSSPSSIRDAITR